MQNNYHKYILFAMKKVITQYRLLAMKNGHSSYQCAARLEP